MYSHGEKLLAKACDIAYEFNLVVMCFHALQPLSVNLLHFHTEPFYAVYYCFYNLFFLYMSCIHILQEHPGFVLFTKVVVQNIQCEV